MAKRDPMAFQFYVNQVRWWFFFFYFVNMKIYGICMFARSSQLSRDTFFVQFLLHKNIFALTLSVSWHTHAYTFYTPRPVNFQNIDAFVRVLYKQLEVNLGWTVNPDVERLSLLSALALRWGPQSFFHFLSFHRTWWVTLCWIACHIFALGVQRVPAVRRSTHLRFFFNLRFFLTSTKPEYLKKGAVRDSAITAYDEQCCYCCVRFFFCLCVLCGICEVKCAIVSLTFSHNKFVFRPFVVCKRNLACSGLYRLHSFRQVANEKYKSTASLLTVSHGLIFSTTLKI